MGVKMNEFIYTQRGSDTPVDLYGNLTPRERNTQALILKHIAILIKDRAQEIKLSTSAETNPFVNIAFSTKYTTMTEIASIIDKVSEQLFNTK